MTDIPETMVEQCDRDAAAPFAAEHLIDIGRAIEEQRAVRNGERDSKPLVQAFVRHRLAAQSSPGREAVLPTASAFITAIADRFQERHVPALARDKAMLMALTTMEACEQDCAPFGHPDFGWGADDARVIADEEIEHWEAADGQDI